MWLSHHDGLQADLFEPLACFLWHYRPFCLFPLTSMLCARFWSVSHFSPMSCFGANHWIYAGLLLSWGWICAATAAAWAARSPTLLATQMQSAQASYVSSTICVSMENRIETSQKICPRNPDCCSDCGTCNLRPLLGSAVSSWLLSSLQRLDIKASC